MKTLVVAGFPCSEAAWRKLFPENSTQILTFAEVLEKAPKADLLAMARIVSERILETRPEMLVVHDFGVATGLMGLIRARKRSNDVAPRVVVFNGAFRGFDVLKAPHPFKVQVLKSADVLAGVAVAGGEADSRIEKLLPRVKAVYRQVILGSLISRAKAFLSPERPLGLDLGNQVLILASANDPFIPVENLKAIERDFKRTTFEQLDYGHFPYGGNTYVIKERLRRFGAQA